MRVRHAVLLLPIFALTVAPFACVDSTTPPTPPESDASAPNDANVAPDTARPDDANVALDSSPADAADAQPQADTGASDATTFDASDAASPVDASDAALADASDASDAAIAPDAALTGIALQFDGVDDHVELPIVDGGASTTAFTVEAWFNTTSTTGTLFEVYSTGGGADRFLYLLDGQVCFYVFDSAATSVCSPTAVYADGAWHHAAGTLGTVSGTSLYVDGAPSAALATPTSSSFSSDTNFRLGYGHTAFESGLVYYGGKLDEVRVWTVERTASEILASYRTHLAGTTTGLQGYWRLDDESGSSAIAKDSTPNGNDGTLVGFTFAASPWVVGGAF